MHRLCVRIDETLIVSTRHNLHIHIEINQNQPFLSFPSTKYIVHNFPIPIVCVCGFLFTRTSCIQALLYTISSIIGKHLVIRLVREMTKWFGFVFDSLLQCLIARLRIYRKLGMIPKNDSTQSRIHLNRSECTMELAECSFSMLPYDEVCI